jgi:hypothetical protein
MMAYKLTNPLTGNLSGFALAYLDKFLHRRCLKALLHSQTDGVYFQSKG